MPPWVYKHEDIHENDPWIRLELIKKNESDDWWKKTYTQDKTLRHSHEVVSALPSGIGWGDG